MQILDLVRSFCLFKIKWGEGGNKHQSEAAVRRGLIHEVDSRGKFVP